MKLTLLDMTQNILSALSSDEVNSIGDTTESTQVAEIIKTTYFNILARVGLTQNTGLFQLDDSLDLLKPVLMYTPDNVKKIESLKYYDTSETSPMYKTVFVVPNDQFLEYTNGFNTAEDNVETLAFTVGGKTFNLFYKNDVQPHYCTVFNNYYIVFDSFDNTQDDTLQASKTQCYGVTVPSWTMEDDFIPELEDGQFPLLLNEAKSLAFIELKQVSHVKAEKEAQRQWSALQRDKSLVDRPNDFDRLPSFGRTPMGGVGRSSSRFIW